MLKHLQARINEKDFKTIKKAAIDANMTLEEFIKEAALHKSTGSCEAQKEEEVKSETNTAD
jgi:uncharacterized protein (DUF1778 family)